MKKVIIFLFTLTILLSFTSTAYAKNYDHHKHSHPEVTKQEFKIGGSPLVKYGRYQLPLSPITQGMGATVNYDNHTAVLVVEKGSVKLVIDFKNKLVTVNGNVDTNSGIFTAKNSKKMTVLIKYIANVLGRCASIDDGWIIIDNPKLNPPTNVTVIPVGSVILPNTLNSTTQFMNASASITAGQAAGGRAELYVGNKLVAFDTSISAYDTTVTFTTSDNSPTNAELQALIPNGGIVSVKLYNANNEAVTSSVGNPTLTADYVIPVISGISSANLNTCGQLNLNVTGAGSVGDIVDVTRISLYDYLTGRYYQLTNGSTGVVKNSNLITISLSCADKAGVSGFACSSVTLNVAPGPFLKDTAGNTSVNFTSNLSVPVNNSCVPNPAGLDAPTNVTVIPVGPAVVPNTLNSTTLYMNAAANIRAGQAAGGRAELYVGNKLVAFDNSITAYDTTVSFTTSDNTPTNAELQAIVPYGGVVSVKLYNAANNSVTSSASNPTLIVDYTVPVIAGISSASFNSVNQLNLNVTGAGSVGDMVDVTRISLYDFNLTRTWQLTNNAGTGSTGVVVSSNLITITLGSADKAGLSGFGKNGMLLTAAPGPFLKDSAGNTSSNFTSGQTVLINSSVPATGLDAPTNITINPVGTVVLPNTLNTTTIYMTASANIKPGQAVGGKAELYVGNKLIDVDQYIAPTDTTVDFSTADSAPANNAGLRALIPSGGVVTVKLYNVNNSSVTSSVSNPTLIVDYSAPTLSSVYAARYNISGNQLYLSVTGAGAIGDKVDVTKLALYDSYLGKSYTLTGNPQGGSIGAVGSADTIIINIGPADRTGLSGFGTTTVYLTVFSGSLIRDDAGNTSPYFENGQILSVDLIK